MSWTNLLTPSLADITPRIGEAIQEDCKGAQGCEWHPSEPGTLRCDFGDVEVELKATIINQKKE